MLPYATSQTLTDPSKSQDVAHQVPVPIIGNGDILTHYEAERRMAGGDLLSVMVGRGALIKPWIFQEYKEGRELCLDAMDRIGAVLKGITRVVLRARVRVGTPWDPLGQARSSAGTKVTAGDIPWGWVRSPHCVNR